MVIPFVQARNYTPVSSKRRIDLIVIHDMEAPEAQDTAENVANWFASSRSPIASAHYCIDADSIVQCVHDNDVAWAAPGANHDGIQLEHAGYARQSRQDWDDEYSRAMLDRSAKLTAELCRFYAIPPIWLHEAQLIQGRRGITGHIDVTNAFHRTSHTDPGPNFPIATYVTRVRYYMAAPKVQPGKLPGPRPIPKWFWDWATWHFQGRHAQRPASAPRVIPPWAWAALLQMVRNRKKQR